MDKRIFLYIILGVLIFFFVLMVFFPGLIQAFKDSGFSGNSVEDKCKPEPGYTEESWREHMGHHPNIYAECLK